jgi:beta-N-acetylhexosaminidase
MRREAPRRQVGQLLVVGLEGTALTAMERAWLKLLRPSGVILFRRNIESPRQTFELLQDVSNTVGDVVFRCVDVEGGLVDRLRDCVAPMPSASAVAATGKRSLFRKHGVLIGREVKALGFNTTLAPVLDLALPVSAAVMRTRVTSADPLRVVEYAGVFLDGLTSEGVLGCGKHFPGLGGGALDSHHVMPIIDRPWDEMWRTDLLPYRRLAKRLPMVMVSHAAFPDAGAHPIPASVSSYWIGDVLKRRLRFRGLIVSDDMEMGGILSQSSIESAAGAAVLAGAHLIEICKDPVLVLSAYEALLCEAERSHSFRKIVEAASNKVWTAKRQLLSTEPTKPPSEKMVERLRRDIAELAAKAPEPARDIIAKEPVQK